MIITYVKDSLRNVERIKSNQREIDSLIFDLYQIPDKNREYIWDFMRTLKN